MNSVLCRMIEKSDRIVAFIVLLTVVFTLKPIVAFAADEPSSKSQTQTEVTAPAKSSKSKEKMNISISYDEKKGLEVKGLEELKKKVEGLKELKALKNLENSEDLKKLEEEIEASLKGIDKVDVQFSGDVGEKEIKKLEKVVEVLRFSSPWYIMISMAPFIFVLAVIFLIFYFKSRSRRETLATLRLMIEKGQPVPPELLASLTGAEKSPLVTPLQTGTNKSFLLSGLKPIFWGVGITLFFIFAEFDAVEWFFGVILILVGLYHMTKSYLIREVQAESVKAVVTQDENSKTDKI